jgi:hypothetical protein
MQLQEEVQLLQLDEPQQEQDLGQVDLFNLQLQLPVAPQHNLYQPHQLVEEQQVIQQQLVAEQRHAGEQQLANDRQMARNQQQAVEQQRLDQLEQQRLDQLEQQRLDQLEQQRLLNVQPNAKPKAVSSSFASSALNWMGKTAANVMQSQPQKQPTQQPLPSQSQPQPPQSQPPQSQPQQSQPQPQQSQAELYVFQPQVEDQDQVMKEEREPLPLTKEEQKRKALFKSQPRGKGQLDDFRAAKREERKQQALRKARRKTVTPASAASSFQAMPQTSLAAAAATLPSSSVAHVDNSGIDLLDDLMGEFQEDIDAGKQLVATTSGMGLPKDDAAFDNDLSL